MEESLLIFWYCAEIDLLFKLNPICAVHTHVSDPSNISSYLYFSDFKKGTKHGV